MFVDVIRYLDCAMYGIGCAFMLITNLLAYRVLRPPKKLGFLWWHVTTISLSFISLGSVALWLSFSTLGQDASWRTVATFVGFLTFMLSQIIIFSVELRRYASILAADKVIKGE